MAIDHVQRARRAWPLLVNHAERGKPPYTYGQLCSRLGLHWRAAQWFLGVIQEHCRSNRIPALQALAVNKRTRVPGKGYVGSPRSRAAHKRELRKVYRHPWPRQAPF